MGKSEEEVIQEDLKRIIARNDGLPIEQQVRNILETLAFWTNGLVHEDYVKAIMNLIGVWSEESERLYVSRTADCRMWTESHDPSEIISQIQGRDDLMFEKVTFYSKHRRERTVLTLEQLRVEE